MRGPSGVAWYTERGAREWEETRFVSTDEERYGVRDGPEDSGTAGHCGRR